jgi:tetratricopeptide (TPR) repeat protein
MEWGSRKVWTAVIPLAVGAAILAAFWGVNASRNRNPATPEASSSPATTVPQNPAHEKAALEEQLKRNPDHPPILMRLAEMEQEAGHPAGAVPYLRKILEKDPKNADARLELGRSLYESGNADGALAETKQLMADHPDNVDGLYNLGAIYANRNQMELAKEAWTKAVALGPSSESGQKARDGLAKLGPPLPINR